MKTYGNNSAPTTSYYRYVEVKQTCNMKTPKIPINITKVYEKSLVGNESALMNLLAETGPLVIAMYASKNFSSYGDGIFYDSSCPSGVKSCSKTNHAMVLVGYGTDPLLGDFWKVKNSWVS
jgi:hypothetical protein